MTSNMSEREVQQSSGGKQDFIENLEDDATRLSRPLGLSERVLLQRERINGWGTVTSALLLESAEELNLDHLSKALRLLPKRYPMLRMRINESGNKPWFEEVEYSDAVDFQLLDEISADNWIEGFEEEINDYQFDSGKGPLWRVRLLKETFNGVTFKNILVFTFLHVICDALSIFELQKKLIEFLNCVHGGEDFEVESLPLRPPLESLASSFQPSTKEKILFSSFFKLQQAKNYFAKPKNLFLSVYPPTAKTDKSVTKKTCLLTRSLSEDETKLLIKSCKTNECKVHGAITASTHLAIARIMQREKRDLKFPVSGESSYTISLRKDCEPKVSNAEFGVYMSGNALSITVPMIDPDDKQGFWGFARACTREVHAQLDTGQYRNLVKLYHCVDIPSYCKISDYDFNEGRRAQILNITNLGALQLNHSEDAPYKFAGSYFALQGKRMGHTFGNNLMTVDGRLYWAVEYFPHVTTKTLAEEFIDLSLEILKQVCTDAAQ